jgi:hypothetical protein
MQLTQEQIEEVAEWLCERDFFLASEFLEYFQNDTLAWHQKIKRAYKLCDLANKQGSEWLKNRTRTGKDNSTPSITPPPIHRKD